jgi:hypothetical protein
MTKTGVPGAGAGPGKDGVQTASPAATRGPDHPSPPRPATRPARVRSGPGYLPETAGARPRNRSPNLCGRTSGSTRAHRSRWRIRCHPRGVTRTRSALAHVLEQRLSPRLTAEPRLTRGPTVKRRGSVLATCQPRESNRPRRPSARSGLRHQHRTHEARGKRFTGDRSMDPKPS